MVPLSCLYSAYSCTCLLHYCVVLPTYCRTVVAVLVVRIWQFTTLGSACWKVGLGGRQSGMERLRQRAEIVPSDGGSGSESGQDSSKDDWDEEEAVGQEDEASEWDAADSSKGEQERPLGERLQHLAHGAGPSRRKHLLRDRSEKEPIGEALKKSGAKKSIRGSTTQLREGDAGLGRSKPHNRANKNRPQEVSSSRAVGRFREVVETKRSTSRDPRFEGGGGSSKLNYDIFRKAYGFLGTYQDSEIEELKLSLKKEKNQERSGRLQALLTRLQQERAERSQGDRCRTALRETKKKEREAVAAGKKPFFLKGSEKKRLSQEQRYEGLREEGKLSKFMEKKRKKNASKDHRWLPAKRQDRG